MWSHVQKLLQADGVEVANDSAPNRGTGGPAFAVPLRNKTGLKLEDIAVGQAIRFSASCPLTPLAGNTAYVLALRHYKFGADVLKNFQLQVGRAKHYFITVAEDEQGQYLSLSRALSEHEQDQWFGRDALSFFMEPSTAKTIRCKADMVVNGDWAGERYVKSVNWVEGSVTQAGGGRGVHHFHYNLLVNDSGEKALEIEHDDASGENRVFVTVYRPVTDIATVEEVAEIPAPSEPVFAKPATAPAPHAPYAGEVPLFKDYPANLEKVSPVAQPQQIPKQRPDFRRMEEAEPEQIHIPRTAAASEFTAEDAAQLPSFLVAREGDYLSLDEVIPPEPERVRVGLKAAQTLIERAMSRKTRVRDVLREMVGLEAALAEEVIFEFPLTDEDYRTLAMRYKLRPDHRAEIRARLADDLKRQLSR